MMSSEQLIESGILESYCLGTASEEERQLVEIFLLTDQNVREELETIENALIKYAQSNSKKPPSDLKNKIFDVISNPSLSQQLPSFLWENSNPDEWIKFLYESKITPPKDFVAAHMQDIAVSDKVTTYVAWATKGVTLEESHSDQVEYLLMLGGTCTFEFNGAEKEYKKGDLVIIPKDVVHKAVVTSDEMMIAIGQRRRAA